MTIYKVFANFLVRKDPSRIFFQCQFNVTKYIPSIFVNFSGVVTESVIPSGVMDPSAMDSSHTDIQIIICPGMLVIIGRNFMKGRIIRHQIGLICLQTKHKAPGKTLSCVTTQMFLHKKLNCRKKRNFIIEISRSKTLDSVWIVGSKYKVREQT